jgi:hypothetical protein
MTSVNEASIVALRDYAMAMLEQNGPEARLRQSLKKQQ